MADISPHGRAVARLAAAAFGGKPTVRRWHNEDESQWVDLLTCEDAPAPGFATYSTVSLHATPNLLEEQDIRVELAGVASLEVDAFPNVIADAALAVIGRGWLAAPGVVFPGMMRVVPGTVLDHIMWVSPFPWPSLGSVRVGDALDVHWLTAVPISESEYRLLLDIGFHRMEAEMQRQDLAYFDLARPELGQPGDMPGH